MIQTAVKIPVIATRPCSRCGGSGHYSYCQMYGTRCFKCGGSGKEPCTPKGQKKIPTTVDRLDKATIGDIISIAMVLYQVIEFKWIKVQWKGFDCYNQLVKLQRLIDGKIMYTKRAVYALDVEMKTGYSIINGEHVPCLALVYPTDEQIGQVVEVPEYDVVQDTNGLAIVKIDGKFELRMRNDNGVLVYVPGYTKAYIKQSAIVKLLGELTNGEDEDEAGA